MIGVVGLVDMTEYRQANATVCLQQIEKLLAVFETDRVEPGTVHRYRWMMQTNKYMFRRARRNNALHAADLIIGNYAASTTGAAAHDGSFGYVGNGSWPGRADVMICGALDTLSLFMQSGFCALRALSPSGQLTATSVCSKAPRIRR